MMDLDPQSSVLDRLLDPIARCFTPEVARNIADLRADAAIRSRLDELADKSAEGSLTPKEHEEYQAYVEAMDFIGILQAKARAVLKTSSAS